MAITSFHFSGLTFKVLGELVRSDWHLEWCCLVCRKYMASLIARETYRKHVKHCHTVPADTLVPLGAMTYAGTSLIKFTWWRHPMETFSTLLAIYAGNSPVTGEFPTQRPVTQSFDVFFDLSLNKRLSKQWWGWWFEMPWCHYDVIVMIYVYIYTGLALEGLMWLH